MLKFNRIITVKIGEKQISVTGRQKVRVEDEAFKKQLLAIGTFEEVEDGVLRYSGRLTVLDSDSKEHEVDMEGYVPLTSKDLPARFKKDFI